MTEFILSMIIIFILSELDDKFGEYEDLDS